jgi:hypothetical protein
MSRLYPWSWCASTAVKVPAKEAYAFMADGQKQSNWAMYSWNRKHVRDDVFVGQSLFDGSSLYVKLVGREELLLVDYYCGLTETELTWQVEARIIPGECVGLGSDACLINMTTWRTTSTTPEQWDLLGNVWEAEIHLIKGLLEREEHSHVCGG